MRVRQRRARVRLRQLIPVVQYIGVCNSRQTGGMAGMVQQYRAVQSA